MFNKIKIDDLNENWVKKIHYEWALIVTNDTDKVNAMTANWLQMGYLWNKNTMTVYVRPERHTYKTMENSDVFSVAFFSPEHKKNLMYWLRYLSRKKLKHKKILLMNLTCR